MNAPDKIYVVNILDDSLPNNTRGVWSCVEVEDTLNTEYIRKDLVDEKIKTAEETIELAEDHAYFAGKEKLREELLKWLEEMKFYASDTKKVAYQNIIDKLNSL